MKVCSADRNVRRTKRICRTCGRPFLAVAYQVSIGKGKYCSLRCAAAAGGRAMTGRGIQGRRNPNWKGGISRVHVRYTKRFKMKYPEKTMAHCAVREAKRVGRLQPKACCKCGSKRRVEAHHPDYSKPLDVLWMCGTCHRKHHALSRKTAK